MVDGVFSSIGNTTGALADAFSLLSTDPAYIQYQKFRHSPENAGQGI